MRGTSKASWLVLVALPTESEASRVYATLAFKPMRGGPAVNRSMLQLAVELILNGASTDEAARETGISRNTLSRYGISKRAVDRSKGSFVVVGGVAPETAAEKVSEIEQSIARSFRSAIAFGHTPLIATAEAAQMESDRLQVAVRASRLRTAARRLAE